MPGVRPVLGMGRPKPAPEFTKSTTPLCLLLADGPYPIPSLPLGFPLLLHGKVHAGKRSVRYPCDPRVFRVTAGCGAVSTDSLAQNFGIFTSGVMLRGMDEYTVPSIALPDVDPKMIPVKNRWQVFAAYYVEEVVQRGEYGAGARAAHRLGLTGQVARTKAYEWLQRKHVKDYIQDQLGLAREEVRKRVDDDAVMSLGWLIDKLVYVIEEAPKAGQWAPAVSAMKIMSNMHSILRDGPTVDARNVNLVLPEGTTLQDLKALREDLLGGG